MSAQNNSLPIPPTTADLATAWAFLEEGVDHIMTKQTGIPYKKHTSLYIVVYNYCRLFLSVRNPNGASNIGFKDLYNSLLRYLVTHLRALREKSDALQGEPFLQFYSAEWSRYKTGANELSRVFTYLNRYWVKAERAKGKKGIYPVHTLALVQWKTELFFHEQNHKKLTSTTLQLIETQRNGDTIDQGLVKNIVDSFVSLGLAQSDPKKTRLDIYKEHFETPFIEATASSFQSLLDSDMNEDLQRMCALLSRIPGGLEPLHKTFEEHVKEAGHAAVSKLVSGAGASIETLNPTAYADALVDVQTKYSEMVARSFRGEAGFVAGLDKACKELFNRQLPTLT